MSNDDLKLTVIIDADNVPIQICMMEKRKYGIPTLKDYGDWTKPKLLVGKVP